MNRYVRIYPYEILSKSQDRYSIEDADDGTILEDDFDTEKDAQGYAAMMGWEIVK